MNRLLFVTLFGAACAVTTLLFTAGEAQPCGYPTRSYVSYPAPSYTPYAEHHVSYDYPVYAAVFVQVPVATVGVSTSYTTTTTTATPVLNTVTPVTTPATPSSAGTSSAPSASTPAVTATSSPYAEVVQLRKELAELRALIKGNPQPAPSETPPVSGTSPAAGAPAVFFRKCAGCHAGTADKEGGRFHLFADDGKSLTTLTDRQANKVLTYCYQGRMPPRNNDKGIAPLTDEEVSQIVGYSSELLGAK